MTEQNKYQEAVEAMREAVDNQLALKWPCPNPKCLDGKYSESQIGSDGFEPCPTCNGTGKGLPMLAVVDSDQSLPPNKWAGGIDFCQNIRLATKQGYDEAQQDMLQANFVKVVKAKGDK